MNTSLFLAGLALLVSMLASPAAATTYADPAVARVDKYVQTEMASRHIPGASVAVVRGGKLLLAKGYGLADVELGAPATASTVYQLASVTKQFTATAVMMLVEDGKLRLDDDVTEIVPGLPPAWKGATIRHLLTHTSGIPSYTSVPDFDKRVRNDYTPAEILAQVRDLPVDFEPGERWSYSNTGYFLLGMVIEKVSGKQYGEFLTERIFRPLGMSHTRVNDLQAIIPKRATGYAWRGKLANAERTSPTQPFAAGALLSTVEDMARWDAALSTTKLLKKSVLEQMWTPVKLNNGQETTYGFGWGVERPAGHRMIGHGGGITGFSTQIERYPDDHLTVIVLSNLEGGAGSILARGIAGLFIPALKPAEAKAIPDRDPKTTAHLRAVLQSIADGKADPEEFTPEARAALFPDRINQGREVFNSLGALNGFELIESKPAGELHDYRYRATFGTTKVRVGFLLAKDGKIAGAMVQPE